MIGVFILVVVLVLGAYLRKVYTLQKKVWNSEKHKYELEIEEEYVDNSLELQKQRAKLKKKKEKLNVE